MTTLAAETVVNRRTGLDIETSCTSPLIRSLASRVSDIAVEPLNSLLRREFPGWDWKVMATHRLASVGATAKYPMDLQLVLVLVVLDSLSRERE